MRETSPSSSRPVAPHIPPRASSPLGHGARSHLPRLYYPHTYLDISLSSERNSNVASASHDQLIVSSLPSHDPFSPSTITTSRLHHPRFFREISSLQHIRRSPAREHREPRRDDGDLNKGRRINSTFEDVALRFDIVYEDGGRFSSQYSVDHILKDDCEVYCSARQDNINILLRFNDTAYGLSDSSCVVTQMIVKSPMRGFTAPCKEGMMFISHDPISVEATSMFDNFTESDYVSYARAHMDDPLDSLNPAAFFKMSDKNDFIATVDLPSRSGKYVLIKLLRSEGLSENIDLQYIGLIGFAGARAFASGTLC